jgi:hypothetical protein
VDVVKLPDLHGHLGCDMPFGSQSIENGSFCC